MTVKERNAITWLCRQGYRPTLGGMRNLSRFELENKDTGLVEYFDISQVIAEYNQALKDERRARVAAKRMEAKDANRSNS